MPGGRIDIELGLDEDGFGDQLSDVVLGAGEGVAGKLAALLGAAGVGAAFADVISKGNEFTSTLNNLQGATGATAAQMDQVKAASISLGNDLSLPATSANDAAAAMTELAKGGFSVSDAMTAAKGTLQLAAAAQIDAADAATIEVQALNAFGLSADDAGHAADVLANVANASTGEITDFASGLQQAGSVASQFGLSIDDTAAALGVLANAGISGSDAGTLLKSSLLALTDTGKPAQAAMQQLGLTVYDAQGKFVGLDSLFGQLQGASQRLTPELYQQATATLFGTDAVRLAGVAAQQGSAGFESMRDAVSKAGGAAQTAAAKTQGLPGAIEQAKSAAETFELQLYDLIDGPLNSLVRQGTQSFTEFSGVAVSKLQGVSDAVTKAANGGFPQLNRVMAEAKSIGSDLFGDLERVGPPALAAVKSVASGFVDLAQNAGKAGGPLEVAKSALLGGASAAATAAQALRPLGALVGAVESGFAALPGPVQTAAVAFAALKFAPALLSSIGSGSGVAAGGARLVGSAFSSVSGPISGTVGAFRQFSSEMQVQRGLYNAQASALAGLGNGARLATTPMSTLAAASAAFRTSTIPAVAAARGFVEQTAQIRAGAAAAGTPISTLGAAFRTLTERSAGLSSLTSGFTSASGAATTFGSVVRGVGSASLSAVGGGVSALTSALGGPLNAAIVGATLAFAAFSSESKAMRAAQDAITSGSLKIADAQRAVRNEFTTSKGALNDSIYTGLASQIDTLRTSMDTAAKGGGGFLGFLNEAIGSSTQVKTQDQANRLHDLGTAVHDAFHDLGMSTEQVAQAIGGTDAQYAAFGQRLLGLGHNGEVALSQIQPLRDAFLSAQRDAASLTPGMTDLAAAIGVLSDRSSTAADRTNALKQAFDALNGKQLTVAEATAGFNKAISETAAATQNAVDQTQGYGAALVATDGSLSTVTTNGQALYDQLNKLGDATRSQATAAYDSAIANGKDIPAAQIAARESIEPSVQAMQNLAGQYGLTGDQVTQFASKLGLVPDQIVTLLSLQGADQATQQITQVGLALKQVPPGQSVTITAPTDDVIAKLTAVGIEVHRIPGTANVAVTAPNEMALSQLQTVVQALSYTGAQRADPTVGMNAGLFNQNNAQVHDLLGVLNASRADPAVGAILDGFNSGRAQTIDGLNDLSSRIADPAVRAQVAEALANISSVRGNLAGLQDRTVTVTTNYVVTGQSNARSADVVARGGAIGGIVEAFAQGGIHKLTPMSGGLAQVVKPDTWRVIGDRVRDDEFFIPDDGSARSMALLGEAARRQNLVLARMFNDGGVNQAGGSSAASPAPQLVSAGGVTFNGPVITQDVPTFVRKQRAAQTRALAQFGVG